MRVRQIIFYLLHGWNQFLWSQMSTNELTDMLKSISYVCSVIRRQKISGRTLNCLPCTYHSPQGHMFLFFKRSRKFCLLKEKKLYVHIFFMPKYCYLHVCTCNYKWTFFSEMNIYFCWQIKWDSVNRQLFIDRFYFFFLWSSWLDIWMLFEFCSFTFITLAEVRWPE